MPSNWLLSRRADLALFGGSTLAALALLLVGHLTGHLDGDAPTWLWVVAVVGVDVAHVWSTGWRVYADPTEFRRRAPLYLAIPALAYTVGVIAHTLSPVLFWRLLAYAAVFHFVRQQYGWVSLYRRKNAEDDGRLLDTLTIYAASVAPLVYWHANQPRRFHWFLAGDFFTGCPRFLGPVALAGMGALLAAYAVKEILRARRGRTVSWGKSLIVFSTALTWSLGIVVFDSDYAFTVMNVIVHGVPYVGVVWASSRQRAEVHERTGVPATLADRAARSAALFLAPLFAIAWMEEWAWDRLVWHDHGVLFPGSPVDLAPALLSLLVPLFALPQATHYLLDAFIWKVRKENTEAIQAMGLRTADGG